jgi:hypothetical protein
VPRSPRPDPARARRVLAIASVVIVAGQLAAGLALDAAPPSVRFAEGARVLGRAHGLGGAPYLLLLGSSRFWKIDLDTARAALLDTVGAGAPEIVQGAVLGGDAIVADYLLQRLLADGSHPVLIVAEISPETIGHPSNWIAGDAIRFFTWRDVAAWAPEIVVRGKPAEVAAARFAPIDVYRRELLSWIVGRPPPYLTVASPGIPGDGSSDPRAVEGTESPGAPATPASDLADAREERRGPEEPNAATLSGLRQTRAWLRGYRLGGEARALERFLARSRSAGIRVVLVGVPVSSWVRALYTPEIEQAFRDYMDQLSSRGDTEFVDYRARFPDRFFTDHHHLNARGGSLFARMLASEVLAPHLHETDRPGGAPAPGRTASPG